MKTLEEKIAVMQAHAFGREVQAKRNDANDAGWLPVPSPVWNWTYYDYRIAPEKLTIYIYNNQTSNMLFTSVDPLDMSYIALIKTIEVEV